MLDRLGRYDNAVSTLGLVRMHGRHPVKWAQLADDSAYRQMVSLVQNVA